MNARLFFIILLASSFSGCRARVVVGHEAVPTREEDAGAIGAPPEPDPDDEDVSQDGENSDDDGDEADEEDDEDVSDANVDE